MRNVDSSTVGLEKISFFLVVLLLISTAVLTLWGGNSYIEQVRVLVFWRCTELLFAAVCMKAVLSTEKLRFNQNLFLLLMALISVACVSVLVSGNTNQSIWGNFYRRDGIITLLHGFLLSVSVAMLWKEQLATLLVNSIAWLNVLVSSYTLGWFSLYYLSLWHWPEWQLWLQGAFQIPNENMIAGWIVVTLPLAMLAWHKKKIPWLTALSFVAIILSQSWGAIMTLLLVVAAFWLLAAKKTWLRRATTIGIVILAATAAGVGWLLTASNSVEGRALLFRSLFVSILQRPVLGWGWARVDAAFESGYRELFGIFPDIYIDKAHSLWLEYMVVAGIAGLVAYIALQIFLLQQLWRLWQAAKTAAKPLYLALFLSVIAFIVHSQTNVISVTEELFFWLIIGICLGESTSRVKINSWYTK